jgi:hypothetical protein
MTDPRTWEDELRSQGKEVKPGPRYKCPSCEEPTQAFAIILCEDGEWRCGDCQRRGGPPAHPEAGWSRAEVQHHKIELTWDDVRGARAIFLQRTDGTQAADAPPARKAALAKLRQEARDLPDKYKTAKGAFERLRALTEQADAV